ncbi:MAG TPA: hypothetical protein VM095_16050 [Pyrinomonadaceae bacterium]|nr:hypothetical protein [Pyrinomonadaceae bacterium]
MRLKLYCNRYAHFKDAIVCSVNCPYRTRCRDFALFYDANRESVDALVEDYFAARNETKRPNKRPFTLAAQTAAGMRELIRLEVKREMPEAAYIWIGKDDQAELLELDEIIRRAERGAKAKNIYRVAQEMELRYQLVPRKRIEKAKRVVAAEAERAAARSGRRPRAVVAAVTSPSVPALNAVAPSDNVVTPLPARRTRKAAGSRQ